MAATTKTELEAQLRKLRKSLEREKGKSGRLQEKLTESFEQQAATAEILKVISSSPAETQPVFDAIVQSSLRLFNGMDGSIVLVQGDRFQLVSASRAGTLESAQRRDSVPLNRKSVVGQAILDRTVVNVGDTDSPDAPRYTRNYGRSMGYRAIAAAPLFREGTAIGAIAVTRSAPGAFDAKQLDLLRTFADQAVIAIENARLFNETKEALERQTATSEILASISGSLTDTKPVFDAIVRNLLRLFGTSYAAVGLLRDGKIEVAGIAGEHGYEKLAERFPVPVDERTIVGRVVLTGQVMQFAPMLGNPAVPPVSAQFAREFGFNAQIAAPMIRGGKVIGAIATAHRDTIPFNDEQVGLIKTFADQAVIAIENVRLFNETKEALERQTATAEILKVISSSPTDVQPVFDAIVTSAMELLGGYSAAVTRIVDDALHLAALTTTGESGDETLKSWFPMSISRGRGLFGKVIRTKAPICSSDTETEPDAELSGLRELARARGFRSVVTVPLIREGKVIGTISVTRREPGPFSAHQLELLNAFADQAVIAIENVRLFNETKEALERQTATAEILKVISSSPTDVQPVFEAIARNALTLCGSSFANVFRYDGKLMHYAASHQVAPEQVELVKRGFPRPPDRGRVAGRAILSKSAVYIEDALADPDYDHPVAVSAGWRRMFAAPMLREGEPLGAIAVGWTEPGPIPKVQEELLKTFADQAVIAIENVRLFKELETRNRDLTETLEHQTATGEILRVISSSPTDVQPVFDTIVKSGVRLCDGLFGALYRFDGEIISLVAHHNLRAEGLEALQRTFPRGASRETWVGQAILDRTVIHIPDVNSHPEYQMVGDARAIGYRSALAVPMLREGVPIGVIRISRAEPQPFSESQIALLKAFADQAVIAIENVRLFKELGARTEALSRSVGQLTALGEVGQAISSSLDLETVLRAIVSRALQLTGLDAGEIFEYDEQAEQFHLRAAENLDADIVEALRKSPMRRGEGAVGRAGVTGEPAEIPEILDASYQSRVRELLVGSGLRALLALPLLRDERLLGALVVNRKSPGRFAPEIVELLKRFATQSALAIQNARLFREIADKSRQLEVASRHKSQFLASMSHELRTPLNAILGFNEMLLAGIYGEVPADMKEPLADIQSSGKHLLRLINNVLDLAKIEAGRMELALADYSVQDMVERVRAALRPLAAEKGLEFVVSVPGDIPLAYGDSGRMTQCLMNLAGNSLKFTRQGRVEISAELKDGALLYRVADTGIGIPPDKVGNLFTEFKQSDATIASEFGGTGLGLSISRKFVEMHRGRIWVESEPGKGSTFFIEVPLRATGGAAA